MTTVTPTKDLRAALSGGSRPTKNSPGAPEGVTSSWAVITPEEAQAILDTANESNRRLRKVHVDSLAKDMMNGDFQPTGDPIRFDDAGHLIDGQHRLAAVAQAGIPIPFLVMRGFHPSVQDVIDSGVGRTVGDGLSFAGISNKYNVASVVRIAIYREEGLYRHTRQAGSTRRRLTHMEVIRWLDAHPEIREVAGDAIAVGRAIGARPVSAWVYGAWVLNNIDPVAFREFSDSLYNASTAGAGDPRATLLQFFRKRGDLSYNLGGGKGSTPGPLLYAMFRVWNAWRDGEELRRLVPAGKVPQKGAVIPDPH